MQLFRIIKLNLLISISFIPPLLIFSSTNRWKELLKPHSRCDYRGKRTGIPLKGAPFANWTSKYWSCLIQFHLSLLSEQLPNSFETVKRHAWPNPLSRAKNTNLLCYWIQKTCNFQHTLEKQIGYSLVALLVNQQCNWALVFRVVSETVYVSSFERDLKYCHFLLLLLFICFGRRINSFWGDITGTA